MISYNKSGTEFLGVQVKTLSKRNPISPRKALNKIMIVHCLIALLSLRIMG